ncbi:uncharacterized protein LOC122064777, partial [Macadamia integrifolia]|uniref:uncharacterized protein LOC122064777 n=1 Tax=Macadamia integrifolia TaxID=60698 RepID=UPI001C4EF115
MTEEMGQDHMMIILPEVGQNTLVLDGKMEMEGMRQGGRMEMEGMMLGDKKVERGLKQGDPISPMLFVLAEEVLCRGLKRLLSEWKLNALLGPRGVEVPSQLLFADDVFIFMNASTRKRFVFDTLDIPSCSLPTRYLEAEIFKGHVIKNILLPLMDKVKWRLQGWSGKLLSMAGRVELVCLVVAGMLVHNFSIYWWPDYIVKYLEKWIRNFIWTREVDSVKKIAVKWLDVCKPKQEGGLGIRRLREVNSACLCKLVWQMKYGNSALSSFLHARFINSDGSMKSSYKSSSIWKGKRKTWDTISSNER